jgi:hypothetical protein
MLSEQTQISVSFFFNATSDKIPFVVFVITAGTESTKLTGGLFELVQQFR